MKINPNADPKKVRKYGVRTFLITVTSYFLFNPYVANGPFNVAFKTLAGTLFLLSIFFMIISFRL